MALQGVGYRQVNDVLQEVSYRLVEPVVATTILGFALEGYGDGGYGDGGYGDQPDGTNSYVTTVSSTKGIYPGALLVVGRETVNVEVVTVISVGEDNTFTAVYQHVHGIGEIVEGATFPTQQPTDPLFTQAEMMGYLSRAQNEFLSQVPCFYMVTQQRAQYGQIFQDLPGNAIHLDRVAVSTFFVQLVSLTRSGNVVTAVTTDPHSLSVGSTPYVSSTVTYTGTFMVATIVNSTTFTYADEGDDGTVAGGYIAYWFRLYEMTQEEITMQYRNWRNDYVASPGAFFEDRTGLYRWGLNGRPAGNFPLELLISVRDDDQLGMLDGFLVPDICFHYVIYKMLEYVYLKDGVRQNPAMAEYCKSRFDRGVQTTLRYTDGMQLGVK